MIKQIHSSSEPQFMCDDCSEAIINPLCPFCLTEEFEAWLTFYPDLKYHLMPRLKVFLHRLNQNSYYTSCIKCSSKTTFVCPYCFTEYVLAELKKINSNKIILKEFFEFFNFDFEHTGYSKEAEKLGVI